MFHLKYLAIVLFLTFDSSEQKSMFVMISQSDPFFLRQSTSLRDLDVEIIENFAKTMKYQVKYIVINKTLGEIFDTEKAFDEFSLNYSVFLRS